MFKEISNWISRDNLESFILNTGNLSDSLGFERVRPLMVDLVELFRRKAERKNRKHTLLLVTKGGYKECKSILSVKPCYNVVISFSINTPQAAAVYEVGAPNPHERLVIARELKKKGWRIRIRIDPMIEGYNYMELARQVYALGPERITLGTLRAEANLEKYVSEGIFRGLRRSGSALKMARYPQTTRLRLYQSVLDIFDGKYSIGLCEETKTIWKASGLDADSKTCNCAI